ncbi:YesL family protein [Oceanobacillus locisalsi]|uniref:YesL family protein n=1 Tax=Oceanobacillus locisalsi TaxID=546107 RepID=A0ABW3NGW9_9BACI
MNGFVAGYYRFALWITRFAYLNLLWIAFSLLGLGLFGFFPATAAMFAVVRKWVQGEKDIPVFQVFWKSYKKEFLKINVLGYMLAGTGYLMTMEFQILRTQEHIAYTMASFAVVGLFLLLAVIALYLFPLFAHFQLRPLDYIKWALLIGIGHPLLTVFLLGIVIALIYLSLITIPVLLFFFGGSVIAYILMWGVHLTFAKMEESLA